MVGGGGLERAGRHDDSEIVGIERPCVTGAVFRERLVGETFKQVRARCDGSVECQVRKNGSGQTFLFRLG
jgi:hypothetical protein